VPGNDERGQVLPLALLTLFAVAAAAALLFNSARLLIARDRVHVRTDVVAMSAATAYARALNFDAAVRKLESTLQAASLLPYAGEAAAALYEYVSEARKAYEEAAPGLLLADLEYLAFQNGLGAVPRWNGSSLKPDLKFGKNDQEERYSYKKQGSGETVAVGKEDVSQDSQGRHHESSSGKYLKKESQEEHSISIATFEIAGHAQANGWIWELPHSHSLSKAKVQGGNFDFFSTSSLDWECALVPAN
jgi:hypothetical protein